MNAQTHSSSHAIVARQDFSDVTYLLEIEHPMAIVILGGLISSTALNLFLMPALYARFGKERPVALGSNEDAWSKNRRAVTVTID